MSTKSVLKTRPLKVFYDGACVVCSKEIEMYIKKDTHQRITWVDISLPSFSPESEGLDAKEVHKVFHVKSQDATLFKGVDGFVKIWDTLEIFAPLSACAKFSLTRPFFDLGYALFTQVRPWLPRKECEDGTCFTR